MKENKKYEEVKGIKCSICGLPNWVEYRATHLTDKDIPEGKTEIRRHVVPCGGHEVMPWQWNKSPDYTKYQQVIVRQHRESGLHTEED